MRLKKTITGFIAAMIMLTASGQDTWYGSFSGLRVMYNPSFAGASGAPVINLSCYSFLPGAGYSLYSVYASYDDFIDPLHGGVAMWISDDIPGPVMNDMRTGLSYAYHFKAGKNLYINAGLTASVIHRGINSTAITLPGDFDPFGGIVNPPSEVIEDAGTTLFDTGTGFAFSTDRWHGAFSVMHLTQPYLSDDQQDYNRLKRLYTCSAGVIIPAGSRGMVIYPSAALMIQGGRTIAYIGSVASYRDVFFGLAAWHISSGVSAIEPSVGWKYRGANITLSYSYNMSGSRSWLPSTAIAKVAFEICCNNVHKRKVVHVIKLPEL